MFVYTVKASRLKFFALLICSVAILLTLAAVIPRPENLGNVAVVNYSYDNITCNEDRVDFLEGFGYTVDETPLEVEKVKVPETFDSVYEKYNDIQRAQGLNLKRCSGKTVTRYTYKVTNHNAPDGKDVLANILVYNERIVGGDICCVGEGGFIHGFECSDEKSEEK